MSNSSARDFGVQSYCFRNFKDNAAVAAKVKEIGLDKIELCGVHADFNDVPAFKDVVKIYNDAGVSIVSLGVQTFVGDDNERDWFECAAIAGAKHISAHFKVDSFTTTIPKVQALSDDFGIRVGIHCHGGYMFGGSPDVLDHLIDLGGPQIGLCIDTAWCMQIGPRNGNPLDWAKKYAGKIYGIHYKDFVFEKNAQWQDVVVGEGTLDLPAFVKALEDGGFDGMAVIEYEADPENPVPALTNCVSKMRSIAG
ncbi:sugar phosphate isomerase/epimerase [Rubellicoccus peritrichatus]|uniref:Sugar phosphate isomerase/epimerase n=1 Tax=Rubellicoccus peritrichatus TaxID=3080537 RepID=A0AAQ3LD16_9BACT|nr:sugar phosphate isomerase/epimerase [Puniceicoccus sp. CR14]WOO42189.1 sugar phosphate isomerase/epimerase [Puniceicoccus sp. CR14]